MALKTPLRLRTSHDYICSVSSSRCDLLQPDISSAGSTECCRLYPPEGCATNTTFWPKKGLGARAWSPTLSLHQKVLNKVNLSRLERLPNPVCEERVPPIADRLGEFAGGT